MLGSLLDEGHKLVANLGDGWLRLMNSSPVLGKSSSDNIRIRRLAPIRQYDTGQTDLLRRRAPSCAHGEEFGESRLLPPRRCFAGSHSSFTFFKMFELEINKQVSDGTFRCTFTRGD